MSNKLEGKKVAILATDGFEQSELFEPKKALEEAGAEVTIVSLKSCEIKGWDTTDWGTAARGAAGFCGPQHAPCRTDTGGAGV